ncbi:MAG: glycosyltransferase [Firmicutes bacterium]|nr:glycosyltransferase [Bacillota bacterium]
MKNVFVVVPTLDPDEEIMSTFIKELKKEFKHILVVNDGSNSAHDKFFKSLEKEGIEVIGHYKNLGKGRGLKNAFNYLLEHHKNLEGVVTCDCDGQHSVKDIKRCAENLLENPNKLVLGVRNFDNDNVPPRSKFGNKITRNIFKLFIGLEISDTQTGLRGLSKDLMVRFMDLPGERYEYETNVLIQCKEENVGISEVEIETIYLNSNANSHFNPLRDSIMIYKLFMKYILVALSSFVLDILLFTGMFGILRINSKILAATILARVVSSIYNYLINSNLIFKDMSLRSLVKYYILAVVQMFISGCFVTYLYSLLNISVVFIKVLVDLAIWVINLVIQREFVFVGDKNEK